MLFMDQEIKKEFEELAKIVKGGFDEVDSKFVTLEEKMATKEDLEEMEDRLNSKIAAIQNELSEIRFELEALKKRVTEDTDAVIKDVIKLKERLDALEEQVKQIRTAVGKI